MNKKYYLFKESDGARGQNGRKKIYVVTVDDNKVTHEWGMAEKGRHQFRTFEYGGPITASQNARIKVQEKIEKGYRLAAAV